MKPLRTQWDYDKLLDAARPYKSRNEFYNGDSKAYYVAYSRGIMNDIANELDW